jgi:hypothetical protein
LVENRTQRYRIGRIDKQQILHEGDDEKR